MPALNDWLRHRAVQNESRFSRTYVVCEGAAVIAYVCISVGGVQRSAAPGKLRRNAPNLIPMAIIGRLAVSSDHAAKGLGSDLMADAFRRIAAASRQLGIAGVMIQAKDDAAKRFYLSRAEFLEYPAGTRTLYLPIETLLSA